MDRQTHHIPLALWCPFRALGGTAVDRTQSLNVIRQTTDLFEQSETLIFALAPEGTRSKTDHWKTGFYHIAKLPMYPLHWGTSISGENKWVSATQFILAMISRQISTRSLNITRTSKARIGKHQSYPYETRDQSTQVIKPINELIMITCQRRLRLVTSGKLPTDR